MSSGTTVQSSQSQDSEQQKTVTAGTPGGGSNRSQLVQRLLDSSANLPAFIHDLLTTQAVTVAGTEAAGFLLERGQAEGEMGMRPIAHIRPDQSTQETRQAALTAFKDLIVPCIQQGRDGAIEVGAANDGGESQFCLVTLLRNEGEVVAASAVITRCLDVARAKQRLMSMQLVAGYFELYTLRRNSEQARMIAQSHQHVLQLATSVATAEGFDSAAMNLCNELATRASATRVSIGWLKGKNIKVKALSHTEEFDKKQELIVMISKVMEECADQETVVQYDPTPGGKGTDNVTRAASVLSRTQGGHIVLSLPLRRKAEVIGVVTLEFLPTQKVGPQVANGLAIAVDLLAPQLYDRYTNDRWLITKAGISTRETAKLVVGPKHMIAKLVAVVLIGFIAFAVLYKPMYKVSAPFQFVAQTKYTLPAPFKGKTGELSTVIDPYTKLPRKIKPGDPVKAGQVLMTMDVTDLKLQQNKARSEMAKHLKMADYYRSEGKDDSAANERAELEQANSFKADVDLLQVQIDDAQVKSPVDGVVLKGDLEDKQFAPVEQGDALFEVGNPDVVKVEVSVAERDIQDVKLGQKLKVATNSLPDDKYDAYVRRIVPAGEAKEGGNTFRVYADLVTLSPTWKPGMAGEARIEVEQRPFWWIYSHRLIDFVKLKLWL